MTARRLAGWGRVTPVVVLALGAAAGCARRGAETEVGQEELRPIRFAIELGPDVSGPIYVALTGDAGPGWVWATHDGRPVYPRERCDIADCGAESAVCGAPVPVIRDLTAGGDRRVEFIWDGMTSVVDSAAGGCEIRRPALPGGYVATFCFSREAVLERQPPASGVVQGRLVRPTCVERSFTLADREVVLRL